MEQLVTIQAELGQVDRLAGTERQTDRATDRQTDDPTIRQSDRQLDVPTDLTKHSKPVEREEEDTTSRSLLAKVAQFKESGSERNEKHRQKISFCQK